MPKTKFYREARALQKATGCTYTQALAQLQKKVPTGVYAVDITADVCPELEHVRVSPVFSIPPPAERTRDTPGNVCPKCGKLFDGGHERDGSDKCWCPPED